MPKDHKPYFLSATGIGRLWFGILAGPVAWMLHLGINHALVSWSCGVAHPLAFHLVTLVTLALSLAGLGVARRSHQRLGQESTDDSAGDVHDRSRFMTLGGLALSAFFTLVIVAQWLPTLLLDPCLR